MSLLYYIILKLDNRSQALFLAIQLIWLITLPLFIIESSIINISIEKNMKIPIFISGMIMTILFNYKFYYREINRNKILKRYTNKYSFIENHPISTFFISYFSLLFLGLFFSFLIPKN